VLVRHEHARKGLAAEVGEEAEDWLVLLSDPHAHLHLYGKAEARKGRKMGHVTFVTPE
jgi:5-(carboxyamino)imidazole ribonucleotide synthase